MLTLHVIFHYAPFYYFTFLILFRLDVGQGNISIPGTIASLLIERPAPIDGHFSQLAPLVIHYGHKSPENHELYKICVSSLADITSERLKEDKRTMASGIVINTCGWVKGAGYQLLLHAVKAFNVDVILVMDQERLYNELLRDVDSSINVVFLPKSGGVVERSHQARAESRDIRIREYFYGSRDSPFYPHSIDIKWSDMKLYKIGAPALPDSCMPIGMKATDSMTKLWPLQPGPSLMHHILALSYAETAEQDVLKKNVQGFVCVTNVDVDRQTVTVLSPQPRPLPNVVMLFSELQFIDSH